MRNHGLSSLRSLGLRLKSLEPRSLPFWLTRLPGFRLRGVRFHDLNYYWNTAMATVGSSLTTRLGEEVRRVDVCPRIFGGSLRLEFWAIHLPGFDLHSRKLTWTLRMGPGKAVFLYKPVVFRVHVSFPGGKFVNSTHEYTVVPESYLLFFWVMSHFRVPIGSKVTSLTRTSTLQVL